jgi:hypothetical protein
MENIVSVIVMYVPALWLGNSQLNIINFWGWEICGVPFYAMYKILMIGITQIA